MVDAAKVDTVRHEAPSTSEPAVHANGSGGVTTATPRPAARPRDARQARFAQTFANIVAVLMRDPNFKNLRLADLEWLVLPPVMAGQFKLGHAQMQPDGAKTQKDASYVPVAVALWARVSPNLDKALSENLDKQARLHPADWATGDNIWLMAAAGDQRAVPKFLEQLKETEFKGKQVKMRVRGPDGKVVIKTLSP